MQNKVKETKLKNQNDFYGCCVNLSICYGNFI